MCPQTPSLSPEYSHKAGLQAVITRMPLQTRPVTQRRPRGARYNGPDHTCASEQDEAVLRGDVTAGLRLVLNEAKGVPVRFVFVKPATAARDDERRVASLPSPQQWHLRAVRVQQRAPPGQCSSRDGTDGLAASAGAGGSGSSDGREASGWLPHARWRRTAATGSPACIVGVDGFRARVPRDFNYIFSAFRTGIISKNAHWRKVCLSRGVVKR
jgi:hypothetical protein